MIRIHKGYVSEVDGVSTLSTEIDLKTDDTRKVLISVDSEYGKYLSPERADYALIGMLGFALRRKHDIICEAPVTDELLYNIQEILIPTLCRSDKRNYPVKIHAEIAPPLEKVDVANAVRGGVGTGLSCGLDSFYTALKHINSPYPCQNLTHLAIFNIGGFQNGAYEKGGLGVKERTFERSEKAAAELNLPLIKVESNLQHIIPMNNLRNHTYRDIMAVYALQKLWQIYYYASAYFFGEFSLNNNSRIASGNFDLFLLDCFSISGLELILSGGEGDRNDKVDFIADNPVAQKYLHVCIRKEHNCGICEKCLRTLLAIDAAGKLDNFRESFNIDAYLKMRKQAWIYCHDKAAIPHNASMYAKTYEVLYNRHKEFFDSITPETKRRFRVR